MRLEQFVTKLEEQFDELKPGTFSADSPIEEQIEWSSMNLLLVISFIKIEFNVELPLSQMKTCGTLRELYNLVSDMVGRAEE